MKTIPVYAHKPGPASKAFIQVFGLFQEVSGENAIDQAEVILLLGTDDLHALYNERQIFCVLESSGQRIAPNQPENVCVIDVLKLFSPEKGLPVLTALIEKRAAEKLQTPAPKVELPEFSDLEIFEGKYSVLVIDDTEQNLLIAQSVLRGHSVVVVKSLEAAMIKVGEQRFDAVLTDMDMPPDKHYAALNLQNYAVNEKVSYGFAVVLEMTRRGIPVAVVTDGNHHKGWVSAMFDTMKDATINGQPVQFFNDIGKRWDKALKSLFE